VPLYDYTCGECGAAFDALVPAGQADRERCRDCGAEARRLLSLVAAPVRGGDGGVWGTPGEFPSGSGAAMPVAGGGGCCGGACGNC
jgi:putative FmdB family regulatory protein